MELPLEGTSTILSFFPDDTIELIRQRVALLKGTHPDRLFIQVQVELPATYYSSNPKRWMELFFRLSYGKNVITKEALDVYVNQIRLGTGVTAQRVTREEWESVEAVVAPLFNSSSSFKEWRILGVPADKSMVLPTPPKDVFLPEAFRPLPSRQSLFETLHPEEGYAFRAEELSSDISDQVKQVYFPFFQSTTPNTIESLRAPIKASDDQFRKLLNLKSPEPSHVSILRAKWYIPLISTKFSAPRTRFEQIFYGLTVSPTIPVITYFTSKSETMRHKFYVEDSKSKKPYIDVPLWKAWMINTQPQRRLPTLLLYRGKDRGSFDRVSITSKNITISVWRGKDSKETKEQLMQSTLKWIQSMDAVVPFIVPSDLELSRWELNDLSVIASFDKEISEFDLRRLKCLKDIFSFQDDSFRLLRSDREFDISVQLLRAYSLLQSGDADLQSALEVTPDEARALTQRVQELENDEHFNFEKALSGYPIISFSSKEVVVKFVSNLERVIEYASLLRYVLTSNKDEVDEVCPREMETIEATAGVAPTTLSVEDEFDLDDFLVQQLAELTQTQPTPTPQPQPTVQPKTSKVKIKNTGPVGTHSYFNNRVHGFDPEMFDSDYPKKCEKLKQVVVLTDEDQARIPSEYNYSEAPSGEKLTLDGGIAVCPQYWCIRDEIPLSEAQLVMKEDGQHCPVCDGKVRVTEKEDVREYTIIKREQASKFPGWKEPSEKTTNKKRVPCCYKKPEPKSEVMIPKTKIDDYYVLTSGVIPGLRIAYIPDDLAKRLNIKTDYEKNVPGNRIEGSASDMFRIGIGLPRETLPELLNDKRNIPTPEQAPDKIIQCSFFRTWKDLGEGDTETDRITDGINRAYVQKKLKPIEEIEYITRILDCRVMRINTETNTMMCGFWSDKTYARSRTIALLDIDVLGNVKRRTGKVGSKFDYIVDVNKFADETKKTLQELHTQSCSSEKPTFNNALSELVAKNMSQYQVILDPFKRVQAVFVPQEAVLPIEPISTVIPEGVTIRSGYADIQDAELPTRARLSEFLKSTLHSGFKITYELQSVDGNNSEFLLESGFRAIFRPEPSEKVSDAKEVIQTLRTNHSEEELISAEPNVSDLKLASEISYSSEVFEFLLFSLSKDVQTDEYEELRKSITTASDTLYKDLKEWLDSQAYWDSVNEPIQFVNKVRTPCGQMEKDSCKKSTLCGWHQSTCKIKVKPIVDKTKILVRLTKTLKDNTKQRALVLDGRLSPFFSTILYLEMPHELITTNP
jgi:hypothetical protein